MRSFSEIVAQSKVSDLLKESSNYLAHTPDETLSGHMELVTHYFTELINVHGLEYLIDSQLLKMCDHSVPLAQEGKQLFWKAILYHDFGKVNENFQRKLGNTLFFENKKNGIDSQHSILSAFIFLTHQISYLSKREKELGDKAILQLLHWTFALSHNIIRHHSPRLDDFSKEEVFKALGSEFCSKLAEYLACYNEDISQQVIKNIPTIWNKYLKFKQLDFEWFSMIRLNFSLLTAADYYATSHYCGNWKSNYDSFGILDELSRNKHFSNIKSTQSHNQALYQNYSQILACMQDVVSEKSNENLNKLRSRMAAELIQNTRDNLNKKLFYIEAPTGGGKTNMAFIATQELLHANPELNKVFYVFPFTTLVTQTKKAAINTLGLEDHEWIELDGRAAWKQKDQKESEKDGLYGEERWDDIHNQFVNYPYTFLSHVRFFDILKANDKASIYLMHRLANSVVVIDEVQAYNPVLWDKMAYLLKEYSDALNIRFVVMSATLPKIGSLVNADFCYLLPNAIERYFTNVNFANRVSFSNELLSKKQPIDEEREEYLQWLLQEVYDKSEAYRSEYGQVRTIIEFIFKKSATQFAELARGKFDGYDVYVMSGTILEPRRKQIIKILKSREIQSNNVLLITTQVIEAGVDIDMDLGFKNRSIVDSEEQLAGRVNRNVNKQDCTVYLFDLDDASIIYQRDLRFKETRRGLETEYFDILKKKNFDKLYDKIKAWLDKSNCEPGLRGTAGSFANNLIGQLNFPGVDQEFVLIDNENTTVFVPMALPLTNEDEEVFSSQQVNFLAELDVNPLNGKICGKKVFELYTKLITKDEFEFIDRRRNLKILQSIMSQFTFSLFSKSKLVKELVEGGNMEEFGYLYLISYKEVYDYELGLLDNKLQELIFI